MAEQTGESRPLPLRLGVAAIRRSKGISLDQIVENTKISKRFLEAIEQGDLAKLPGGIFNTSYVRQYARAIDIDETELLGYYNLLREPASENGNATGPRKRPPSKAGRILGLAARY